MSRETVEVIRRAYERFNRTGELDYSLLDPEIVYDASRLTFDAQVYHGHAGLRQLLSRMREQWASMRLEPQELIDAGDDVLASVRFVGVGRRSGVEAAANTAQLWTVRSGKAVRQVTFQTMAEALEAIGTKVGDG
jgi:ketosteroid isomerase-like protein